MLVDLPYKHAILSAEAEEKVELYERCKDDVGGRSHYSHVI